MILAWNSNGQTIAIKITNRINLLKQDVLPRQKKYYKYKTLLLFNPKRIQPLSELKFQIFFLVTTSSHWLLAVPVSSRCGSGGGQRAWAARLRQRGRRDSERAGALQHGGPRASGQRPARGGAVGTAKRPFVSAQGRESSHFLLASCWKWI